MEVSCPQRLCFGSLLSTPGGLAAHRGDGGNTVFPRIALEGPLYSYKRIFLSSLLSEQAETTSPRCWLALRLEKSTFLHLEGGETVQTARWQEGQPVLHGDTPFL